MELNNFYDDYAFTPEDFDVLDGMYKGIVKNICDYMTPLQDNRIARYIEDYRFIPMQYLDISEGTYDIYNIFTSEEIKVWNDKNISMSERVEMLRNCGKYISIVAERNLFLSTGNETLGGVEEDLSAYEEVNNGKIINFTLKDPDNNDIILSPGVDYYYSNNQLFLFGDYADVNRTAPLKMIDIAIDFDTVSDILSKNLELGFRQDAISKVEFNDFIRVLTLSALKGFKVNGAMGGISELPSISEYVTIFDRFTDDPDKAEMWNETDSGLGPFDFVIMFPLILDKYRVSLIGEYIDKVRHVFTNYQILGYDFYDDEKYAISSNFDDLYEDVIYRDWESDSDTKKYDVDEYAIQIHAKENASDELEDSDNDEYSRRYNDDTLIETPIMWPTPNQLYTEGDRVVSINRELGEVITSKDDPTITNDADSRLGYADEESKRE